MNQSLRILIGLMLFSLTSYGQITGHIQDDQNENVSFANTIVKSAKDSSIIKVGFTEDDGRFVIAGVTEGQYFLEVTYIGLATYSTDVFEYDGNSLEFGTLVMKPGATELNEVTVRAKKPLVEVLPDRTKFNVEGSINAQGNTALDLLRKAPGVVVDNNDNLSLMGKNGVRVYINGRPSIMRGDDLSTYLKSLNSADISSIDIITNPSARYDAEGNAGIIDIILKKNQNHGANANINVGFAQGITPKGNASISSNYRNDKVNIYGNYAYSTGIFHNYANFYREQVGQIFEAENDMRFNRMNHNVRLGMDYSLTDNQTIGVLLGTNLNSMENSTRTITEIRPMGSENIDRVLVSSNDEEGSRNNYDINLNYQLKLGKESQLSIDLDYGVYDRDADGIQPNTYFDGDRSQILSTANYKTESPTDISIYTMKVDYDRPFLKGTLGVGLKSTMVETDNRYGFYLLEGVEEVLDMSRSNIFIYNEWVNAGYFQYQRQLGKFGFQAGLRAEHTSSEGDLKDFNGQEIQKTPRDYLSLFPSGGVSYTVNRKNSLNLTYSRRIDRPSYQDLNPFEFKLSELSFRQGNAFLRPQYTHSIQLTHTFNYRLNTSISYSHVSDVFAQLTDTINTEGSFIKTDNLATNQVYNLNVSYPFSPKEWWNVFITMGGTYTQYQADFGDGRKVDLNVPFFNVYGQTSFLLPKNLSFELSGWWNSGGVWGGIFKSEPIGGMSAGLQWKFNERGNIKLSMSDLFRTMMWGGKSDFGAQYVSANGGWEARQYKLNFSYSLGNQKVKKSRKRKTGLDDEKSRLNGGGDGPGGR